MKWLSVLCPRTVSWFSGTCTRIRLLHEYFCVECPQGWILGHSKCYKYFPHGRTWYEARIICKYHGGILVEPRYWYCLDGFFSLLEELWILKWVLGKMPLNPLVPLIYLQMAQCVKKVPSMRNREFHHGHAFFRLNPSFSQESFEHLFHQCICHKNGCFAIKKEVLEYKFFKNELRQSWATINLLAMI